MRGSEEGGTPDRADERSGVRLQKFDVDDMTREQRSLYEAIVSGRRSSAPGALLLVDDLGRLEGPFNSMLLSPAVGFPLQGVGVALRYEALLSGRAREVAILATARWHVSAYEWRVHEKIGAAEGLSPEELSSLRSGKAPASLSAFEHAVYVAVTELLERRDLSQVTFEAVVPLLGEQILQEVVTLVGYYELLALVLRVWRVPLPGEPGELVRVEAES
jgi:4-carboxymuconolactone decarboxylase